MKKIKKSFILISALAGISAVSIGFNIKGLLADALPLPKMTFTHAAKGEQVALQKDISVTVNTTQYKYFAMEVEFSPNTASTYIAYNISLTDSTNTPVVSLSLTSTKINNAVDYPDGLSSTDFASATNSCRKTSTRMNLPTTKQGYFVAQKSTVFYSTFETNFKGTVFYYLPDYTDAASFTVSGILFANNDQSGKTTTVSNSYFCEDITKVASAGFASSGNAIDFKMTSATCLYGAATVLQPTAIAKGKGVSVTAPAGSGETIVSFEDQVTVSLASTKYLAIDTTFTTPNSSNYYNANLGILDNKAVVSNDLLLNHNLMADAKTAGYPADQSAADFSGAVGACRANVQTPNPTDYSRVSYLTSTVGTYVPVKADNSFNFVFKGGSRYTIFIYLPDFQVDNFKCNALSIKGTTAAAYTINQVYLCERVIKLTNKDTSTTAYVPAGTRVDLPIISAQSTNTNLAEVTVENSSTSYFYADADTGMKNGTVAKTYYVESSKQYVSITPTPASGYVVKEVKLGSTKLVENSGKYDGELAENGTIYATFGRDYYDDDLEMYAGVSLTADYTGTNPYTVTGISDLKLTISSEILAKYNDAKYNFGYIVKSHELLSSKDLIEDFRSAEGGNNDIETFQANCHGAGVVWKTLKPAYRASLMFSVSHIEDWDVDYDFAFFVTDTLTSKTVYSHIESFNFIDTLMDNYATYVQTDLDLSIYNYVVGLYNNYNAA